MLINFGALLRAPLAHQGGIGKNRLYISL